jgi:uncharacterized protein YkwD
LVRKSSIYLKVVSAGSFFLAANCVFAAQGNTPRFTERRMPAALATILCERNATAEDFVKDGIFDAQIDVAVIKPKSDGLKVAGSTAQKRAAQLAENSEQLGYAFGTCERGGAWVATLPTPFTMVVNESKLSIPATAAKDICAPGSLKILFSPEKRGRSLSVPLNRDFTANLPSPRGYVGVMCTPKAFPNSGPREWAIIPVGGAPAQVAVEDTHSDLKPAAKLLMWINEKRQAEALAPLASDSDFTSAATELLANRKIRHDIHSLTAARMTLVRKGREPLGENRVAGQSFSEIAGLLWKSPSHRNLILNAMGDAVGIAVNEDSQGLFAVMVVGHKLPKPVATLKPR